MNQPLISIIIPVYNRAHLIGETLDSVLAQTYQNWECIIVDDGSTDTTVEVVNKYINEDVRFNLYHRPKDRLKGGNAARNFGFEISNGDYVLWLDSDDLLLENCLSIKIDNIIKNSHLEAIIAKNSYANFEMTSFRDAIFPEFKNKQELLFLYGTDQIQLQTTAILWSRLFLKNKSLFDENFLRYQDNDFNIRMFTHLQNYTVVNTVLATIRGDSNEGHRISSVTKTSSKKLLDIFEYRFRSLQIFNYIHHNQKTAYIKIVSSKALWCFYKSLSSCHTISLRWKIVIRNLKKINMILRYKEVVFLNRIKSYLYLFKLVIFR